MRWRWAWLLAGSLGSSAWAQDAPGPDTPGAAPLPPPEPAAPVSAPVVVAGEPEPAGPGLRWQVPPIAVSGSVGYELRLDHARVEPSRRQQLLTATVNAASYLYQPWFASISGTLSLSAGHTAQQASALDASTPDSSNRDRFATGALRLGLFPRSRFPFEARYEVADSRTDSSLGGGADYRATTLALTQRYRPARGEYSLSASVERRTQDGESFGRDTQTAWLADFSTRWARQQLSASLSRSTNRRQATGEETDFFSLVARHSWASSDELSVESGANWARSDDRLVTGDSGLTLAQWSTLALWRPQRWPLTVSASLRGFSLSSNNAVLDTESVALGVGASYEINEHLRLSGNLTATRLNGQTDTALVGSLGATMQGDTRKFGEWSHDWFGGATLSSARNGQQGEHSLSLQLGQTVSRQWTLGEGSVVSASLGQTAGITRSTGALVAGDGLETGLSRALSHTASLTWSATGGERSGYARVSFSDARQFDGERARFQLFHAQVSGNWEVDRNRGWSGDLTLQRVLQKSLNTQVQAVLDAFGFNQQVSTTASGEITWRQQRVFDVPRLRFSSRLRVSHDSQRQVNALVPLPDRETLSWENRLDWQVGRLDTGVALRVSQVEGRWREFFQWRLQRHFGD